jgi:hypothetical protein
MNDYVSRARPHGSLLKRSHAHPSPSEEQAVVCSGRPGTVHVPLFRGAKHSSARPTWGSEKVFLNKASVRGGI